MVSGFSDYRSPVGMANENCRSVLRCKNSLGNRDIVLQRYRRVLDDAHLVAVPLQDQKSSHPRGTVPPRLQTDRKMAPMAMRVTEMGASEGCPVIGQIEVASPRGDKITTPETELTSCWCSAREPLRNRCMKQGK